MIENSLPPRRGMTEVPFPFFAWHAGTPLEGPAFTQAFLKHRPDEHWVLVGEGVAQCHAQLWTAWHSAARRQQRGTSLARSFDAEFLRYLAGTHHVSEAFKRAGVRNEDLFGCFLRLPVGEGSIETLPQPDPEQVAMIESQAADLAASLGVKLTNKGLECTTEGAERLGLLPIDTGSPTCDALVGHVLSAEFHS